MSNYRTVVEASGSHAKALRRISWWIVPSATNSVSTGALARLLPRRANKPDVVARPVLRTVTIDQLEVSPAVVRLLEHEPDADRVRLLRKAVFRATGRVLVVRSATKTLAARSPVGRVLRRHRAHGLRGRCRRFRSRSRGRPGRETWSGKFAKWQKLVSREINVVTVANQGGNKGKLGRRSQVANQGGINLRVNLGGTYPSPLSLLGSSLLGCERGDR
jgi:hypothetical protein